MPRVILHLDLDAFFCAVEENLNPDLRGLAFAVGGDVDQRGVVASCSYPARMYGVRSAMPMRTAKKLCPQLVIVPQTRGAYQNASRRVMGILDNITPLVEQLSIDEAFLDVTGVAGSAGDIARRLQQQIHDDVNLPSSLGVATSKLVAKIANNIGKARKKSPEPPCAIEVVPPGSERDYLASLPIRELWGIGPKTAEQLHQLGITTIGEIALQDRNVLVHHFGKNGYDMWQHANGIDTRPVDPDQDTKSISHETTFAHDVSDGDELRSVLRMLVEQVGHRLRKNNLAGKTISIKLRWADFTTLTRQITIAQPTQDDKIISDTAMQLFTDNWPNSEAVRLIGVGVSNFEQKARQLELWESEETKKQRKLQKTLDDIRDKFGDSTIKRGVELKRRKKK